MRITIIKKITTLLFLMLAVAVINIWIIYHYQTQARRDIHIVNVAGRQRMLSQRIAKSALAVANGHDISRGELEQSIQYYDSSLAALWYGSEAVEGYIPPAPVEMKDLFQKNKVIWKPFKEKAEVIVKEKRDSPYFVTAVDYVRSNNDDLLKISDRVTVTFDNIFSRKALFLRILLLVMLGGNALVFIIGYLIAVKIVEPLKVLSAVAVKIGSGDFTSKAVVTTKDEIGDLALSFDKMGESLKRLLSEITLAKDYTDNIIQSIGDALLVAHPDGTIVTVNKASTELTGYSQEELLGKNIEQLFPEFDTSNGQDRLSNHETHCLDKDSRKIPATISCSSMKDSGGLTNVIYTVTDDTERKKEEKEKANLEAQLRQSQKLESVGTMANGIAHTFNNVLGTIRGYADMSLKVTPPETRVYLYLKHIIKGTATAKELADDMLMFSRNETQNFRLTDIESIVQEAIKLFKVSFMDTVTLHINLETISGKIFLDPNQIEHTVMNLCQNAYHAVRDDGGEIAITLKQIDVDTSLASAYQNLHEGPYAKLTITDTGRGMDKKTLEHIFEPFFTTKPAGEGTGLGLSVVHGIMTAHKGSIIVKSSPGEGTTFDLYFPLADGQNQTKEE